jgi:hypothetical protein
MEIARSRDSVGRFDVGNKFRLEKGLTTCAHCTLQTVPKAYTFQNLTKAVTSNKREKQ